MTNYKEWRTGILKSLVKLADIDYQRRVWLNTENPLGYVSSFVETICVLYDDNQFELFFSDDSYVKSGLKETCKIEFDLLNGMINSYNEPETHSEILSDPNWVAITKQAKNLLRCFEDFTSR